MTYARLLSEATAAEQLPSTGDVLAVGLPFLRQLDDLHRQGQVSRIHGTDAVTYDGTALQLATGHTQSPKRDERVTRRLDPPDRAQAITVQQRVAIDGRQATSLDVHDDATTLPDRPMFEIGYRAWEQSHGVHDELTDTYLAGLLLAGYAFGLDLDRPDDVHELALRHRHLTTLNPNLHPVVAGVLTDLTQPSRHRRPAQLSAVSAQLEHHREVPPDLDLADAYAAEEGWRKAVLATLRERVFDVSRRNRALYFKPTSANVSLTEASVPLLLDVNRIRPDDLLTWTGKAGAAFRSGKAVDLEQWCRFEEAPHLAPALDTMISNERKLRAEHGHGRLQLIAAFLRWVDPETDEHVNSPLFVTPAELTRKKGVRNRYRVQTEEGLDVNPVLRHVFRSRFGVTLPERIDGDAQSILTFVADFQAAVRATEPSLTIDLVDTPRIHLIRRRAQLRVDAYRRRKARAMASQGRWRRQDHSYDHDDWRPLGLALYRRFVRSAELPLRSMTDAAPRPPQPNAMAPSLPPPSGRAAATLEPPGTREQTNYAVSTGDVSRHRWEVDLCAVTLASLGSRRTNLARDYDTVLAAGAEPSGFADQPTAPAFDSFESIFAPVPRRTDQAPPDPFSVDQPLVLPADDAQARAVRKASAGESFIIQGPPGTGKSQTITNLLATLVADGQRVLFVCEKRAAIDVVAHRLRQVGLGEIVATVHDSQLDRKEVIADLGATYESWLTDGTDEREAARGLALAAVHEVLDPLERLFAEVTDERGDRASLASIVERLVGLRVRRVEPADHLPDGLEEPAWRAARPAIDRVVAAAAAGGRTGPLAEVAALHVQPNQLTEDDPVVTAREVGAQLSAVVPPLLDATAAVGTGDQPVTVGSVRCVAPVAGWLTAFHERGVIGVLDRSHPAHLDLRAAQAALDAAQAEADQKGAVRERWSTVLDAADARAALSVAQSKEGSAFKFLSGSWRKVKSLVHGSYRFADHQVEPSVTQVLAELVAWHDANDAVAAQRAALTTRYGADDLPAVISMIDDLAGDPLVAACAAGSVDVPRLVPALQQLGEVTARIVADDTAPVAGLTRLAAGLEATSVVDEPLLLAWRDLAQSPVPVIAAVLQPGTTPDAIERAVLDDVLRRAGGVSASMSGARLDEVVDQVLARYRTLLDANAGMVAARAKRRFLDHVEHSEASMAGRSDEDKELKRTYNAGRRLLEREFQKKMRFRSIRELAAGDSGAVVRDLKPIWLMSPLSVSDTLPLDGTWFDAVVFDEASQIPVEDAVPSLFRAPQVIVVGDRMQLPPTRFFAAETDDDDGEVDVVDDDGHRVTVTLDADSFLTQADLSLPSSTLTWHYRSRSESLIAYSNHAFYDARLATVPDRLFDGDERPDIVVSGPDDARDNLAEVLARPISFHRVPHGVYEQRRNTAEADYVAELVRAVLVSGCGLTIGVVAFSEAQQTAIESSLADLAAVDQHFAELYEAEQNRVDDGEYVGLFVKNLENVQGDERELIIMSVCYGPDPNGKMRMNFGPINQAGGERRLNVIFSRAKQHMAIVSTIEAPAITNLHNDGAAHLARFLAYAQAESAGGDGGEAVLRSLRVGDESPGAGARSAVAAELAGRLRREGIEVDTDVGRSQFTIDVAIRGNDGYRLGVLIDPGDDDTSAEARLVSEAGVLDAFGWPLTRVMVTDWWTNPDDVVAHVTKSGRVS